jgi:hypothetical protein
VFLAGGRAVAKRPDNLIVWESPLLNLSALVGMADLDDDGLPEIVTWGARGRVVLLSGRDGSVVWQVPAGPIGEAGTVRVTDFDGDGIRDLYIGECRCCTLHGTASGVAYSFAGGFTRARELWQLEANAAGCGSASDQIADVDGDGRPEIIVSTRDREIAIASGTDGRVRWRIPAPASGGFYPGTAVFPVNLDADRALELVVLTNGYFSAGNTGARRIAVWDYTGGATPFTEQWEVAAPSRANDAVTTSAEAIADFDGDGTLEVAFSVTTGGTTRMEVRTALTGGMRAMRADATVQGAVDLDSDGRPELLAREGRALVALRLDPAMGLVHPPGAGRTPTCTSPGASPVARCRPSRSTGATARCAGHRSPARCNGATSSIPWATWTATVPTTSSP